MASSNNTTAGADNTTHTSDVTSIICIIIGVIVTTVNIMEIYVIARLKKRKNLERFLLSLSVSDLCVGLLAVCLPIANIAGADFSVANPFFILISVLHLICITGDRLWAVTLPIQHNIIVTKRRIWYVVASLWIVTATISVLVVIFLLMDSKGQIQLDSAKFKASFMIFIADVFYVLAHGSAVYTINKRVKTASNRATGKAAYLCCVLTHTFVGLTLLYALFNIGAIPGDNIILRDLSDMLVLSNAAVNSILYLSQSDSVECVCYHNLKCFGKT